MRLPCQTHRRRHAASGRENLAGTAVCPTHPPSARMGSPQTLVCSPGMPRNLRVMKNSMHDAKLPRQAGLPLEVLVVFRRDMPLAWGQWTTAWAGFQKSDTDAGEKGLEPPQMLGGIATFRCAVLHSRRLSGVIGNAPNRFRWSVRARCPVPGAGQGTRALGSCVLHGDVATTGVAPEWPIAARDLAIVQFSEDARQRRSAPHPANQAPDRLQPKRPQFVQKG